MPAALRELVAWTPVLALAAAAPVAWLGFARDPDAATHRARFAVGLVAGAACALGGGAVLHGDPGAGASILLFPVGVLASELGLPEPERARYRAAALRALPLAWAVARVGCLAAGCCGGVPANPFGAWTGVHPTPVYEMAGLAVLHVVVRDRPPRVAAAAVLAGFGGIRLAVEPLRAAPAAGPPLIPAAWLAALWVAAGLRLGSRAR